MEGVADRLQQAGVASSLLGWAFYGMPGYLNARLAVVFKLFGKSGKWFLIQRSTQLLHQIQVGI